MSDEPKLNTYTIIGVYAEDDQRFAEVFEATSPDDAGDQATAWADGQVGSPEIVIAGVVAGDAVLADAAP